MKSQRNSLQWLYVSMVGLVAWSAPVSALDMASQFTCVPMPRIQAPPPLPGVEAASEEPERVCPEGMVPQPLDLMGPKRRPDLLPALSARSADVGTQALTYMYVSGYQYFNAAGISGNVTQHAPFLATGDYHTLAELAAQSADGQQIVEIGWTVDRGLYGDSTPRLFVFHWVNGQPTCYNGCGYVQISSTRRPGMAVQVTTVPQTYQIYFYQGNWWLNYQGDWIGYFPGSRWGGTYTSLGLAQWFGEVAANVSTPCTDMGNGRFGTWSGSAVMNNLYYILSGGATAGASVSPTVTHPTLYDMGNNTGTSFTWGGPGGC